MKFERVINGINKYINAEVYETMNDWQEILARIAVSRMLSNTEQLKQGLASSAFLRTFSVIDDQGNVDVDGLARDLKEQIAAKGKLTIALPLMPALTFKAEDVDTLYQYIVGG